MDVTVATGWKRLYMVMCQQIWRQIIIVPNLLANFLTFQKVQMANLK